MTTRNASAPASTRHEVTASAIEQRVVGGELTRFFFEHHRHAVADRVCEPVETAHEQLRLASELQRPLAHRAGENLQQSRIHQVRPPAASGPRTLIRTRASSSRASGPLNSAVTGTYHNRGSALPTHFTASFSVISTGNASPNSSSRAAKG